MNLIIIILDRIGGGGKAFFLGGRKSLGLGQFAVTARLNVMCIRYMF